MRKTTNKQTVVAGMFGGGESLAWAVEIRVVRRSNGHIALGFQDSRRRQLIIELSQQRAEEMADAINQALLRGPVRERDPLFKEA